MSSEIYSAGVLPYCFYENTIYFLLGRDSDNKWSDFGGRVEPKDKYDHETTACRECFEETLGCIYDYNYLKKNIKKCHKITSKTSSGHNYYMFLLKINYNYNVRTKFQSTRAFLQHMDLKLDKKYIEKNDVRWLSLETINHCLNDHSIINLRSIFINTLKLHYDDITQKLKM